VVIVLGSFIAAAIVTSTACSSSVEPLPPLASTATARRDAGTKSDGAPADPIDETDAEATHPIVDGAAAQTFKGTLAETLPVKFGGDPYCQYSVKLKPIVIEVAVLDSGEVIAATVQDTTIEAVIPTTPPCPYGPMEPSAQTYALTTTVKNDAGTGLTLSFKGAAGNRPTTSLVIDLVKNGASYDASCVWKRTDISAPLDWQIKAKLTLTSAK